MSGIFKWQGLGHFQVAADTSVVIVKFLKQNRILLCVCIVTMLLFLGFYFWLKQAKIAETKTEEITTGIIKESPVPKGYPEKKHEEKGSSVAGDTMTDEEKKEKLESLSPRLQKMVVLAEASIHPIEFWGKVVDQNGDPLGTVDILFKAGGGYFGGGSGYGRLQTDVNGLFHVTGQEGGSLNLIEMKKEGYQIATPPQDTLFYNYKKYPDTLLWTDYTEDNPFIYNAWKYSDNFNKEKLIHDECTVYFRSDGIEYSIDLFGPPKQRYNPDLSKGQLKVLFNLERRTDLRIGSEDGKWQLVLTALEGGIMRAESLYTNEASENGYQESLVLSQDDYRDGRYGVVKSFYLHMKGKDGSSYARLSFELNPYLRVEDGIGVIHAKYTINPTGERYLDTFDGWVQ